MGVRRYAGGDNIPKGVGISRRRRRYSSWYRQIIRQAWTKVYDVAVISSYENIGLFLNSAVYYEINNCWKRFFGSESPIAKIFICVVR